MAHLAQQITSLIEGHTNRRDERTIIDLLRRAPAADLDEALREIDVAALLDGVDDHLVGADHRQALLDLLAGERRGDVSLHAHAALIRGMQAGRTSAAMERAIRDILTSYAGNDLTHLKNTINLAQGRHDLEGLLFSDIDDDGIRAEIIEHFAAQSSLGGRRQAKTLSDIDDTAIARLHETRYPKGIVIPGLIAFYEALDRGPQDEPVSRGDLTFVTARPSDALGLVKGASRGALADAGFSDLSIMTGSVLNLATHDAMAAKKVENIAHYAQMFPEYDLVFVGDSGQGDIAVGEKITEAHPDVLKAVFIHDVVALDEGRRAALAAKGIWVVDTYVGAAVKAHALGLVSADAVGRVVAASAQGLDAVEWESDEQERATRALHEHDAAVAANVRTQAR